MYLIFCIGACFFRTSQLFCWPYRSVLNAMPYQAWSLLSAAAQLWREKDLRNNKKLMLIYLSLVHNDIKAWDQGSSSLWAELQGSQGKVAHEENRKNR